MSQLRAWTTEEVGRLVSWMEDNQERLQGKQVVWHNDVKKQVFPNEGHITVKKITDKATNMKRSWKKARELREASGWGARAEDNEVAVNEELERRCAFYWRLEEIWGSQSHGETIIIANTTESIQLAPQTPLQPTSETIPPQAPSGRALQAAPGRTPQAASEGIAPPQATPGRALQAAPGRVPQPTSEAASEAASSEEDSDSDLPQNFPLVRESGVPTATPRSRPVPQATTPAYPIQKRSRKRNLNDMLMQVLEERHVAREEASLKRLQAEMDFKRERMAADERIAQLQADAQVKQAQAQADAQIKQMETFAQMMQLVVAAIGASGGASRRTTGGAAGGASGTSS